MHYRKTNYFSVLVALLIVSFTLTACGGDNSTPTPAASGGATTANTPASGGSTTMTNTQVMTGTGSTSGGSSSFTPIAGGATSLTAGGATFPDPLYEKWFAEYKAKYGVSINYQAKGSGFGVQNIQSQTIDFGGSDAPMSDAELAGAKGGPMVEIPTCLGAVVVIYNIPGYSGKLKLSGDTLAKIYLGTIKDWSDPAITADNGSALPAGAIQVVHRSDSSGTSFIFTSYLAAVNSDWKSGPGANKAPNWPVGQGGAQNPGVAGQVKSAPFSIGYVEIAYAVQNNLSFADMKNKNGKFVTASLQSIAAAAANLTTIPADLRFSLIDQPGDETYPIASSTWQLVYQNQTDQSKAIAVVNLLNWELSDGQSYNESLSYGKLPANLLAAAQAKVKTITVNGKSVMP